MKDLRKQFKNHDDKNSYYEFFTFINNNLQIQLTVWEEDALEERLDRLGMAFIEFNEFNEFCLEYGINFNEPLIENDIEEILQQKLNVSYKQYKVRNNDYFN